MNPPTTPTHGTWHADDDLLARYAAGTTSPSEALSVEAHVLACSHCQQHLSAAPPTSDLDRSWAGIADRIDAPASPVARALQVIRLPDADSRLVEAAFRLHGAWFAAALGVVLTTVVLAGLGKEGASEAVYLILAPIVPLLSVALAYGPATDPAWEAGLTSPLPQLRVLLVRSTAVLLASLPVAAAVGLLAGAGAAVPAALLPGLALAAVALALGARVAPLTTSAALAPAWVAVTTGSLLLRPGRISDVVGDALIYRPGTQVLCAAVAAGALAFALHNRSAYDRREDLS